MSFWKTVITILLHYYITESKTFFLHIITENETMFCYFAWSPRGGQ
jgi:hypothetical protein